MNATSKEKEMLRMEEKLATAFEVKAEKSQQTDSAGRILHRLELVHRCEKKGGEIKLDLDWLRCPWCSKQIPQRIRRIFQ